MLFFARVYVWPKGWERLFIRIVSKLSIIGCVFSVYGPRATRKTGIIPTAFTSFLSIGITVGFKSFVTQFWKFGKDSKRKKMRVKCCTRRFGCATKRPKWADSKYFFICNSGYFVRRASTIRLFMIRSRSSFFILQKTEMIIMKMDWLSGKYLHNGKHSFCSLHHCEPHRSHGSSTRRSLINDTSRT